MKTRFNTGSRYSALLLATLTGLISTTPVEVEAAKLKLTKTQWLAKKQSLTVTGKLSQAAAGAGVELYDVNGRLLGIPVLSNKGAFSLTLKGNELPSVPCAIRAQSGSTELLKPVVGAPKSCNKVTTCSITEPVEGAANLTVNQPVNFKAQVKPKGKGVTVVSQEWDFAGGALQKEPFRKSGLETTATFVRDNSTYRVRFVATDSKGQRCEDSITVAVGTPPTGLPNKVSEQATPKFGAELDGVKGDLVVLPAPQWTMQHLSDARINPNLWASFSTLDNTLNAYVYRKDLKPMLVGPDAVTIQYSAASNPSDPVGPGSINSTSQNWPVGTEMAKSVVRKSDMWESYTGREDAKKADASTYQSISWMGMAPWAWSFADSYLNKPEADVGYFQDNNINFKYDYSPDEASKPNPDPTKRLLDPGSQMPGKANPFSANDPKPLVAALGDKLGSSARMIPVTDVDDKNRVNPFPLMRVQAVEGGAVKASTDGVLASGKDFKCRECHAKGGIAANPNAPHTKDAFYSTAYAKWALANGSYKLPEKVLDKPEFFEAASNSIEDQEYAAAQNYSSLHQFYDAMTVMDDMIYGRNRDGEGGKPNEQKIGADSPMSCEGCHGSALAFLVRDEAWWQWDQYDWNSPAYDPDYSPTMHRFHGQLQYKSDSDHSDIKREASGIYSRYTGGGLNKQSLFPIFDANGKQLPMEENCLKCHSGHREPLYRDRMFTAGVTCYDCHGDMLAVGQTNKKPANRVSADGNEHRVPWFDEPDCGSCHTGNGSVGSDKANGYFSAGVKARAFDDADNSGITRKVDLTNTDAARFAVVPVYDLGVSDPTKAINISYTGFDPATNKLTSEKRTLKVQAPLYREGKDAHGNVPCAACHGGAHEVWPNRDPNANDNVTALQLQGHTGTILECSVCHDKDSFKNETDLDGGTYSGDTTAGILGGPHNTHPINDPYWWNKAGDGTNGGWHNNYAMKPGKNGEDQCAACHGADHKGTRLSKTPVERVFINAKAKGIKRKVVVAAGTPIGCGICHDVNKSFTKSAAQQAAVGTPPQSMVPATSQPVSSSDGNGGGMGSGR